MAASHRANPRIAIFHHDENAEKTIRPITIELLKPPCFPPRASWLRCLLPLYMYSLGVGAAVDGQVGAGDIRRLRPGDESHQRGDFVNLPVAVKRCGGVLGRCPIAGGGIQIRVDRTRLNVVDSDAAFSHLAGQPLSEHLDGSLRGRVGHQAGRHHPLTDARADNDDTTAAFHVLQRCLGCDQYAADIDVEHAVQFLQRGLLERLRNGRASIVHKHVDPTECRDRLLNGALNGLGIDGVRLNGDGLAAGAFDRFDNREAASALSRT